MKQPKKIEMENYMGKRCNFTGEYYRVHLKTHQTINPNISGYDEETKVVWRIEKLYHKKEGWIVGFGYVFNGKVCQDAEDGYRYFQFDKRVNYVRVRVTAMSPELKIPLSKIQPL